MNRYLLGSLAVWCVVGPLWLAWLLVRWLLG